MAKSDAKRRGGQLSRCGSIDAVFFGSDGSSFVTGIVLFTDGGIPQV